MTIINDLIKTFKIIRSFRNSQIPKDYNSQWLKNQEQYLITNKGGPLQEPAKNSYIVNKCVNIISQNFPAAPLVIYSANTNDPLPPTSPEYDIFRRPNENMSSYDLWSATSLFFTLYGEAFWYFVESVGQRMGTRRAPAEIIVLDPRIMEIDLNADNTIRAWIYKGKEPLELKKDDIIQFKNNNPYNPYRGLSSLDAISIDANTDYKASQYQEVFFRNGAVPSVILKTPEEDDTSIEELRKIARMWDQKHAGAVKAHKTAVLRGGMSFDTIGLSQQEMDFIDSRQFTRDVILSVFGVPKVMAGFTEGINRATAETQIRIFWQETMKPQLLRVQAKLNADFFPRFYPGRYCRFDFRKVDELQKEFADDVKAAKDLFQMGFSRNELNERFDLGFEEDLELGNDKYVPLNLVPASVDIYEDGARSDNDVQTLEPGQAERSFKPVKKEVKQSEPVEGRTLELFNRKHGQLEKQLAKKVKGFFFNQRSKVLKLINEEKAVEDNPVELQELINIQSEEDERFIKAMTPYVANIVEEGQNMAYNALGVDREVILNRSVIATRMGVFKTVNDTVFKQLRKEIFDGINNGESIQDIIKRIKSTYNKVNSRATIIARTEVTSALNLSQMTIYEEEGVRYKKWLTAKDERVRDSHRSNSRQGPIPITASFGNGEKYPGQASVNCRCTLIYAEQEEDL